MDGLSRPIQGGLNMEMSIFEKDGKTYTRFKVTLKEFKSWQALLEIKTLEGIMVAKA